MRKGLAAAFLVIVSAALWAGSAVPASAPHVTVALGYAHGALGLRPWAGSPNTIFVGAARTCCLTQGPWNGQPGWDSGAIEITNDGGPPVTVDAVTVDVHGATPGAFALWWRGAAPHLPQVLAPHAHLVLTMRSGFDFDTSELAGEACTPNNRLVAAVNVTVDGKTTVYRDDRQIITTAGADLGSCPGASENWPFTVVLPGHQPAAKPVPRATPQIRGTPAVAHILSGLPGAFSGSPVPRESFQWLRCKGATCAAISGASALTYRPAAADLGRTLRLRVTARNTAGVRQLLSAPTRPVAPSPALFQLGNVSSGTDAQLASDQQKELLSIFSAPKSGTTETFEFYAMGGANTQSFTPSIYTVVDGKPAVQIGKGAPVTVAKGALASWYTSSLAGTPVSAGQQYALVLDASGAFNGTYVSRTRGGALSFFLNCSPS